jgi:APA family basic amino acid/polyamine antiporter
LFGSFAYGELGASLPRNGGEYNFLSRIYHPLPGFLAGWVSVMIGFAAPIAAAALALGDYSIGMIGGDDPTGMKEKMIAIIVAIVISGIHLQNLKAVSRFQKFFTIFKILLIIVLIILGFTLVDTPQISFAPTKESFNDVFTMAFAGSLVWVMLAYSGWNAAAYIVGDLKNPGKNLPRSLFIGTAIVAVLYVLLNAMFLYVAPISDLAFQKDVGNVAAQHIFGQVGVAVVCGLIAFALISSISSMIWAGPRVSSTIGEDMRSFKFLSKKNKNGVPHIAILFQLGLIIPMILFVSFGALIEFTSVLLSIFTFMTVLGVFVLRIKEPNLKRPYKAWGYPVTPIIYLLVTGWMIVYFLKMKPQILVAILITLVAGTLIYYVSKRFDRKLNEK